MKECSKLWHSICLKCRNNMPKTLVTAIHDFAWNVSCHAVRKRKKISVKKWVLKALHTWKKRIYINLSPNNFCCSRFVHSSIKQVQYGQRLGTLPHNALLTCCSPVRRDPFIGVREELSLHDCGLFSDLAVTGYNHNGFFDQNLPSIQLYTVAVTWHSHYIIQ